MISILTRTVVIYLLLTISMKIMGKRQIGELEVGELISTLLISEIISIPIDTPEVPLLNAVLPLLLIISVEIIISFIKNKSSALKNAVEGKPAYVIFKGKMNVETLYANRISINEVLSEMRSQGIGDIGSVEYCILEPSGKLSFFEREKACVSFPLIVDGKVDEENLNLLGISLEWVKKRLEPKRSINGVFLMTADTALNYNIIYKEEKSGES